MKNQYKNISFTEYGPLVKFGNGFEQIYTSSMPLSLEKTVDGSSVFEEPGAVSAAFTAYRIAKGQSAFHHRLQPVVGHDQATTNMIKAYIEYAMIPEHA